MYEKKLVELGLTEGEAKVYSALLSVGSSTVGPIVKKSGVAYSNIYEILDRLMLKGIVSFVVKSKTKYYNAAPPNRIGDYLDSKRKKLDEQRIILDAVLPKLSKLRKEVGGNREAEVFVGFKGVRTAYEQLYSEIDKKENSLFFYYFEKNTNMHADNFFLRVFPWFQTLGIKWKGISMPGYKTSKFILSTPAFIEMRYVDFPVPGTIDIYRDKILILSWSENPVAILITSNDVAEQYKSYFWNVWNRASN